MKVFKNLFGNGSKINADEVVYKDGSDVKTVSSHVIRKATASALGHIIIGDGLAIDSTGTVSASGFKNFLITRNISLAGNQSVSVGFRPRAVIFFASVSGVVGQTSWGIDDGVAPYAVASYHNVTANTNIIVAQSIRLYTSLNVSIMGHISRFSASGFTIAWEKVGSPTGTAQVIGLALK